MKATEPSTGAKARPSGLLSSPALSHSNGIRTPPDFSDGDVEGDVEGEGTQGAEGADGSTAGAESGQPAEAGQFPCILHFDSLHGDQSQAGRISHVLREYLQCEWDAQLQQEPAAQQEAQSRSTTSSSPSSDALRSPAPSHPSVLSYAVPRSVPRRFDVKTFPHVEVSVPTQLNDFDCGPFVLEFAQRFCQRPFDDTRPSHVHRPHWFRTGDVRKRDEIRELLEQLHVEAEYAKTKANTQAKAEQRKPSSVASLPSTTPRAPREEAKSGVGRQRSSPAAAASTDGPWPPEGGSAVRRSTAATTAALTRPPLPFTGVVADSDGEGEEAKEASDGGPKSGRRSQRVERVTRAHSNTVIPSSQAEWDVDAE